MSLLRAQARPVNAHAKQETGERREVYTVSLDRENYFDNDTINVTVTIVSEVDRIVLPPYLIMVGRMVRWESGTNDPSRMNVAESHIIYRLNKTPPEFRDDFYQVTTGRTVVKAVFVVPEHLPASFHLGRWELQYGVWLMQKGPKKDRRLAEAPFEKGSLFFPIIGHRPTAQAERIPTNWLGASYSPFQLEASLAKDVFSQDEPIVLDVAILNEDKSLADMVGQLTVMVFQAAKAEVKMTSTHGSRVALFSNSANISSTTEDPIIWQKMVPADGVGMARHKTIFCDIDPISTKRSLAVHWVRGEEGKFGKMEWAASANYQSDMEEQKIDALVEVTYYVQLNLRVTSGKDISLKIPFSLENAPDPAIPKIIEQPEGDCALRTFPQGDEPPPYDEVDKLSVSSYTHLRLDNPNSVFNSPTSSPRVSRMENFRSRSGSFTSGVSGSHSPMARARSLLAPPGNSHSNSTTDPGPEIPFRRTASDRSVRHLSVPNVGSVTHKQELLQ